MKENKKIIGKGFENIGQNPKKAEANRLETIRKPAHLVNQFLKNRSRDQELTLFSELTKKLEQNNDNFLGGYLLTEIRSSEYKALEALNIILHESSQRIDPSSPSYFMGNVKTVDEAPVVSFSLYSFAKELKGGANPSGKDIENAKNLLLNLSKKLYYINYQEKVVRTQKGGKKTEELIQTREGWSQLLKVEIRTLETKEGKRVSQEAVVTLDPIFKSQIANHYINIPRDWIKLKQEAYGSKEVPMYVNSLADIILEKIRYKETSFTMYASTIYRKINRRAYESKKWKDLRRHLETSVEVCKKLGILKGFKETTAPDGEIQYIFTTNKEHLKTKKVRT